MVSQFVFVLNGIVPIFLVIAIGFILKSKKFLTGEFVKVCDKLVFKLLLPCYLFNKVAYMEKDKFTGKDITVVLYALGMVLVLSFGMLAVSSLFIKDSAKKGAFVQGVYRSNTAILGVPFAENLFGDEGARITAVLLAFVVPLYNVIAVIILSMCDPTKSSGKTPVFKKAASVGKDIAKNPLIISILLGLLVCFSGVELPQIFDKTVAYLSGASTPLALLAIGANFSFKTLSGRVKLAVAAAFLKTAVFPLIAVSIAALAGFSGAYLGSLFVVFGTPSAVSSYIMAKNMNNDYHLASQIIITTTVASAFTIALGSFILLSLGAA